MTSRAEAVQGRVAEGFDAVGDVFQQTLDLSRGGAAFAAVVDGELVVDLWGGSADDEAGRPWAEDTVQLVFSGTKGLVAVCLLLLIERGALRLEEPVSRYWPEFAAAGKEHVLVRDAVSHLAAVPGLRRPLGYRDLLEGDRMTGELAAARPFWQPGTRLAYHALTYGWLCAELVRRVDGRSIGRFFADEVSEPLGLELWIGLPAELEPRVARLYRTDDYEITVLGDEPEPRLEGVYGAMLACAVEPWNEPAFHRAEIAAANAIGTARSIARLYGCLARGGEIDGVRLLAPETVKVGRAELSRGPCAITRRPYAFGTGFELQTELAALGPPQDAFGHTGSGGSRHGAWPSLRVGFSYAMSELRGERHDDRARGLLGALHRAAAQG
jgi:CubicO group peptidase (beta-lactamase class C family)